VGLHKLARILGLCLEYMSTAGESPGSPNTPFRRAGSYGFAQCSESSGDIQHGTTTQLESSTNFQSRLDVLTMAGTSSPVPVPTLVIVMPRSIVLLIEDNSVNMKAYSHNKEKVRCANYSNPDPRKPYEACETRIYDCN
jgi:hypothetical protein